MDRCYKNSVRSYSFLRMIDKGELLGMAPEVINRLWGTDY